MTKGCRVVIAPDSFGGSLTAPEAARAMAAGWSSARPDATCDLLPLSDGGPGFVEVLSSLDGGVPSPVPVRDPLGRPVEAVLYARGTTVFVEAAQACGLERLAGSERDPLLTTTAGVGDLLEAALALGPSRVVVGLGGSATNDGGAGMLARLGLAFLDGKGRPLATGGGALRDLERIVGPPPWPPGVELVAATDVDSPLTGPGGATAVFARQKGADDAALATLEAGLERLRLVAARDLPGASGRDEVPGAGAAGGLGFGLELLGGSIEPGAELVASAAGLDARLAGADLVVTGEGSFDRQSLRGKVVSAVARHARATGCPCIVLAGQVSLPPGELERAGIEGAYSLVEEAGSLEASLADPARHLASLAARVASAWHRDFRP